MSEDFSNIHIESSLPKSWEEETTFNDVLYDWMGRAPWLAISAVAHVMAFLLLAVIPWGMFDSTEPAEITAAVEQAPEEVFEDPEEEEIEEDPTMKQEA